MNATPNIVIYEFVDSEEPQEREVLCSPEEFFQLATVLSCAVNELLEQDAEEIQPVIKVFKHIAIENDQVEDLEQAFIWFCQECRRLAIVEGESSWMADHTAFDPAAARFLALSFFVLDEIDEEIGGVIGTIFNILGELTRQLGDLVEEAEIPNDAPPFWYHLDRKKTETALVVIERFTGYCEAAVEEGRRFTVIPPEDQDDEAREIAEAGLEMDEQGRIILNTELPPEDERP